MIVRNRGLWLYIFFINICLVGLSGCSSHQDTAKRGSLNMATVEVQHFEEQVDALVKSVVAKQYGTKGEFAPVAVVPGAIKHGVPYTHLEEVVGNALRKKLQATNELYEFTSQNWFEYREGRPLSFWRNPAREREFLKQLKIFEVRINPEPLFAKVEVEIVVSNAMGHTLQGQRGSQTFDFFPSAPAARLHASPAHRTPFPEGTEERPFTSIDRFAFSLVGDLIDTYQVGVLTSGRHASDEDVQVVVSVTPTTLVPKRTVNSIVKSLQQAIVRAKGVTCVLNPNDRRVDEDRVQHGTVLLVVDFDRIPRTDKINVAMRGVWRVSPLETASGSIVDENLAGTYLAGFTAKGYLLLQSRSMIEDSVGEHKRLGQDMTVCFYGADDALLEQSYKALRHIPNVKQLEWTACADDHCGCWDMTYLKSVDVFSGWLRRHLPHYTDENEFTVRSQSRESIDVHYLDVNN